MMEAEVTDGPAPSTPGSRAARPATMPRCPARLCSVGGGCRSFGLGRTLEVTEVDAEVDGYSTFVLL